ncbi:MAG: hemolysin family protein [Candidatus Phosphoribacter sp.]
MSLALSLSISAALLVLNAFFVAAEFAVIAAKRHRLEDQAAAGSGAARIAVRNSRELSLVLAAAQLGITLCTLGLGALAKPALADLFAGWLGRTGLSESAASIVSVLIGVAVVVFLHMVIGEMAPKSWAISHPERSAVLLARPSRAVMTMFRWPLAALNALANLCLRAVGVSPVNELAQVHGPHELRMLLDASREEGLLDGSAYERLHASLGLPETPVYAVTLALADAVCVGGDAGLDEIEQASRQSGRSRLVVLSHGAPIGLVHVRDAILAGLHGDSPTALELAYPTVRVDSHVTVLDAVQQLRAERAQLALVTQAGQVVGIAAMEDMLERLLGDFEDETDRRR